MKRKIFTGFGNTHFITFSTFGKRRLLINPQARQIVISQLGRLESRGRVAVSGFVVMPDHVHALLWFDDTQVNPLALQRRRRQNKTKGNYIQHFKFGGALAMSQSL